MQIVPTLPAERPTAVIRFEPAPRREDSTFRAIVWVGFTWALAAGGCGPSGPTGGGGTPAGDRPFAGAALTVACPAGDPAYTAEFRNLAAGWAAENGATVRVLEQPSGAVAGAGVDAVVVRPADVGRFVAAGATAVLPADVRRGPAGWVEILPVYRSELAGWAGVEVGLPTGGDGYALVYRADLFADPAHKQGVADRLPGVGLPPDSWADLADVAGYFAATTGRPSLPAWPADDAALLTQFHQIAACYDRPAASRGGATVTGLTRPADALSFHVDIETGRPRLTAPGFVAALDWLARTHPFRPPTPGDPVESLASGSGVMAVLSLSELARLPRDGDGPGAAVSAKFGVAPLPGTDFAFGPDGQKVPAAGRANYVPYLGSGGRVGLVMADGKNQPAAWSLLGYAAGRAGSQKLMTDPAAGVGPYRTEHLADDSGCWHGYGFDPARTKALADAMQRYVSVETSNPALALRTPRQAELMAALATQVRSAATGQKPPEQALKDAEAGWERVTADVPADELRKWRRNSAGVQ